MAEWIIQIAVLQETRVFRRSITTWRGFYAVTDKTIQPFIWQNQSIPSDQIWAVRCTVKLTLTHPYIAGLYHQCMVKLGMFYYCLTKK